MEIKWDAFEAEHWQGIVFVIVGTTFLAYLLNVYALGIVEPTVVSIYIYLQPLIVMLILGGLVYMGVRENESDLNIQTAISALAIFTGVWLVSIPNGWLTSRSKA
jgi:drug/metabolite transporter (DMT)-like permease